MQTNTIKKDEFSRTSDKLVKHTVDGFNFLTVGTQEPEERMKALAVTLRDSGDYDSTQTDGFNDLPIICGSSVFDVWQNVDAYTTEESGERLYDVMTEEEAECAWDEALDSYLDDCILPELPENARSYFDTEKWKRDAKMDGRGHFLNHYDGSEEEANIDDVDYYIYRTN